MKKIMILGGGKIQTPIIEKINQLNYQSIVVDFDSNAPGMQIASTSLLISTNDTEAILLKAKELEIDGILTTSDFPVNVVAKVSLELGLQGMSTKVAEICTDKFKQRSFFKDNGINHPFFRLLKNCEEVSDLIDYPYIIKPLNSSASRGVIKVNSYIELQEEFSNTMKFSGENKIILIEKFIDGREFSVETLTQNFKTTIVAITEKITRGEKHGAFVEDTHIIPARLREEEKNLIHKEVIQLIEKLQLNNCPTHTEVKLNNSGVFVIEIACRLGGDYITSDLVKLATGIDMMDNLIKISLGEEIDTVKKYNKVAAIQFLNDKNYKNGEQYIKTKSTSIIRSEIEEFHSRPILNSSDRMGYLILQTEHISHMEEILSTINQLN
jgi:biotin carboxylase